MQNESTTETTGVAEHAALVALWELDTVTPEAIRNVLGEPRWPATRAASPTADAWWRYLDAYATARSGQHERGFELADDAHRAAVGVDIRVELLSAGLMAFLKSLRGDHNGATADFAAILADPRAALTAFDRAVLEGNHGTVLWIAGHLQEAARCLMNCLAAMRHEGRRQRAMLTMCNLGQLFVDLGDPASAEDMRRELASLPETAGHPRARVVLPALRLSIGLARRDHADARVAVDELERVYEAQGFVASEAQIVPGAAEACVHNADLPGARRWLKRADAQVDPATQRRAHALCERARALLALGEGDASKACTLAHNAAALLEKENYPFGRVEALETLAVCEEAVGNMKAALEARKRHAGALRALADNANRSRHFFLETRFRLDKLAEERDRAQADSALHARHARELEAVNHKLALHLEEVESLRKEVAEQALRDALTGLYNRRRVGEVWPMFLQRASEPSTPVFVAMIDIDHFKRINDEYGHAVGDEVLKAVALALVRAFRGGDLLLRYGGEEFCVVAEAPSAIMLCARLEGMIQILSPRERREARGVPPVSFSAGVARVGPGETFESATGRADAALYRAKHAGRARVFVAEDLT
jgi:diguanylate cyclase (GGDEF)-like protein